MRWPWVSPVDCESISGLSMAGSAWHGQFLALLRGEHGGDCHVWHPALPQGSLGRVRGARQLEPGPVPASAHQPSGHCRGQAGVDELGGHHLQWGSPALMARALQSVHWEASLSGQHTS